eukprot:CAMPEP_0113848154 /NCGR_PEP_ID=MMETSP0372-20130328/2300_1 /TAXON_ID=340204 /ORGANISM="Lankesteria abbotti" /LENGTH=218 /DNA_ID=CAMNT_0000817567 /DNA_START=102 /DNA_END=756 /DNA_ORIENTATION=+ /assembly_acc=CAM_ASM_000359
MLLKESSIVRLNVGGVEYLTSRETLLSHDDQNIFQRMLRGTTDHDVVLNIDRDGSVFGHILQYKRKNHLHVPSEPHHILDILDEALFFGMESLAASCKEQLEKVSGGSYSCCEGSGMQLDGSGLSKLMLSPTGSRTTSASPMPNDDTRAGYYSERSNCAELNWSPARRLQDCDDEDGECSGRFDKGVMNDVAEPPAVLSVQPVCLGPKTLTADVVIFE